jgi:hypothetical protein
MRISTYAIKYFKFYKQYNLLTLEQYLKVNI